MAKTREFMLYSDSKMANPNGDMINDNRPRQDERTGALEMSDARIKRYSRDGMTGNGIDVFVKPSKNEKGKVLDCKGIAKKVMDMKGIKDDELEEVLKKEYLDVKLFGAVVTKPKFNILGPLQILWSRSIHEAEIKFTQGTSVMASKEGAEQGTIWSKYYTPYALFSTYMIYNDKVAKHQNIEISEEDIETFKESILYGIKEYKSTSKNQIPRLLVEVIYNKNYIDGELDFIDAKYEKQDLELRDIKDFTFDFKFLVEYFQSKKDIIDKINIYKHPKVNIINSHEDFKEFVI